MSRRRNDTPFFFFDERETSQYMSRVDLHESSKYDQENLSAVYTVLHVIRFFRLRSLTCFQRALETEALGTVYWRLHRFLTRCPNVICFVFDSLMMARLVHVWSMPLESNNSIKYKYIRMSEIILNMTIPRATITYRVYHFEATGRWVLTSRTTRGRNILVGIHHTLCASCSHARSW